VIKPFHISLENFCRATKPLRNQTERGFCHICMNLNRNLLNEFLYIFISNVETQCFPSHRINKCYNNTQCFASRRTNKYYNKTQCSKSINKTNYIETQNIMSLRKNKNSTMGHAPLHYEKYFFQHIINQ